MARNILIERTWARSQRLYESGELVSTFVRLGEIYNYLNKVSSDGGLKAEWGQKIDSVPIGHDQMQALERGATKIAERLRKILSVGSKYSYEEILLIITFRVELELLQEYLLHRGTNIEVDTENLDDDIQSLSSSQPKLFAEAKSAAISNWGIPLSSKWI